VTGSGHDSFIHLTPQKLFALIAPMKITTEGIPMEEVYRMAGRAWDEAVAAGRVERVETAFGTVTLLARNWVPDGVAFILKP
jgi:hypothetical protein